MRYKDQKREQHKSRPSRRAGVIMSLRMSTAHSSIKIPRRRRRLLLVVTMLALASLAICLRFVPKQNSGKDYNKHFLAVYAGIDKLANRHGEKEEQLACTRPNMELWHASIKKHFFRPAPLNCSSSRENFVYVDDGKLMISRSATEKYGQISCDYRAIVRINDSSETLGDVVLSVGNGTPITSDFFQVDCISSSGLRYTNVHPGIKRQQSVVDRAATKEFPQNAMRYNVLMFGFDSVSRLNWLRNLPKSDAYFTEVLGGVTLEGYNIVGDGTPQALLPILTGKTEEELPEARRGFPRAKTVDGHPWIWKEFADAGYVTQWGEDGAQIGTFNFRMLGFDEQPVDHYYRPYQHFAESRFYKNNTRFCIGSELRLDVMLKWIRQFFDAYPALPKFSFLFHSEYSHGSFSTLSLADETIKGFLVEMKASGRLNETILLLMADHGARFAEIRNSLQGKYEERLPYFSIAVPQSFAERYPSAMSNLRHNRKMLTVPFDIHATFKDIIDYKDRGVVTAETSRGISLFQAIPASRTCSSAGVAPHWCTCMAWAETSLTDERVASAANQIVRSVNALTNQTRHLCVELALSTILAAQKYTPNEELLKFKKSADIHGRRPDFSDNMTSDSEFYQLTIKTKPGGALYEATVTYFTLKQTFSVSPKDISRINRYGNQPHCIMEELPHLRAYCHCKNQIDQST